MHLEHLTLALLVTASLAFAQPQAPVVWGEARWLGLEHVAANEPPLPLGDTLIISGTVPDTSSPPAYRPTVTYSHDNGFSTNPWQYLSENGDAGGSYPLLVGNTDRAFAFYRGGIWRSTNGGVTWMTLRSDTTAIGNHNAAAADSQVIRVDYVSNGSNANLYAVLSNNGGDDWNPGVLLATTDEVVIPYNSTTFTRDHILQIAWRIIPGGGVRLALGRSDRTGQTWTPFTDLFPAYDEWGFSNIVGDLSSNIATILQGRHMSDYAMDLAVRRTTDAGETWEDRQVIASEHFAWPIMAWPQVFGAGQFWGVAWEDRWNPDTTQRGIYMCLSANHAKNWYPPQPIGIHRRNTSVSTGQVVGNEVHLYWSDRNDQSVRDLMTVTGIMTPDTLPPDLTPDYLIPDSVAVGAEVMVGATASDNDTLSEVRLAVIDSTEAIATLILPYSGFLHYDTTWIVPYAGYFRYRYEAEDWWENVATYPDTGWLNFATEGYVNVHESVSLPASFEVSVYPNPANGPVTLSLSPDWYRYGPIEISVFNLLGESVTKKRFISASGTIPLATDPLASGIYFLHVSNAHHTSLRKLLILK